MRDEKRKTFGFIPRPLFFHPSSFIPHPFFAGLGGLLLTVVLFFWPHPPIPPETLGPGPYRVAAVENDGILQLDNGAKVRLLGILPAGPTRDAVAARVANQPVRLRFDRNRKDPAGRFLAYVYLPDVCLNEDLLQAGAARAAMDFPFDARRKQHFLRLEQEAHRARRGLWSRE